MNRARTRESELEGYGYQSQRARVKERKKAGISEKSPQKFIIWLHLPCNRGTDSSKKKAKTEAAQKVLEKLKTASGGEGNEEMFVSNGLAPQVTLQFFVFLFLNIKQELQDRLCVSSTLLQVGSLTIKDEDRELLEKMEKYTNIKLDVLTPEASDKVGTSCILLTRTFLVFGRDQIY